MILAFCRLNQWGKGTGSGDRTYPKEGGHKGHHSKKGDSAKRGKEAEESSNAKFLFAST